MKDQTEFFEERIAEAQRAIANAMLQNVKAQAILARDRWVELAGQHAKRLVEGEKVRDAKLARDEERLKTTAEITES